MGFDKLPSVSKDFGQTKYSFGAISSMNCKMLHVNTNEKGKIE